MKLLSNYILSFFLFIPFLDAQISTELLSFLNRVDESARKLHSIQIELDINLKYFTNEQQSNFTIEYYIRKDTSKSSKLEYVIVDKYENHIIWTCDIHQYDFIRGDSIVYKIDLSTNDYKPAIEKTKHKMISTWLSDNFSQKILSDSTIKNIQITFLPESKEYQLKLEFYPIGDVEFFELNYYFDPSTYYMTRMTNRASWDNMEQHFEYKLKKIAFNQNFHPCEILDTLVHSKIEEILPDKSSAKKKELSVGDKIKVYELKDFAGNVVSIPRKDKHVLLNFSYLSCYPCRKMSPVIDSLFKEKNNRSIEIISINPFDEPEKIKKYMDQKDFHFPVMQNNQNMVQDFGITGYPRTVIIDPEGIVLFVYDGYSDQAYEDIKDFIIQLK